MHVFFHFYPRDAMRKRGVCCRPMSVRLSVRPSRWWIVSTRLKEDIVKLIVQSGSTIHLVFDPMRRYPTSRETPSARGRKIHWGGKNLQFLTKITVYPGNGTILAIVFEL